MGAPPLRVGRDIVAGGIVEGRVHQHAVRGAGDESRRRERVRVLDIGGHGSHPAGKPVALDVVRGERAESRIDLHQRHIQAGHAPGQRQSRGADPGAELDRALAGAAAGRRGEQDRVVADAVPLQGLPHHEAATEHGVAVCYAPGRNAGATAEHTLALILAAVRRIPQTHADLVAGHWRGDYYRYEDVGFELLGSTVGLVGCGAVGRRVARMLAALGAKVLVHDPYLDDLGDLAHVAELVELDDLLARAQIVSLHARATPQTTGMIGAAQIAAMAPGSIIVNCARGSLLDYKAACDAVESGHLFAAAFDVFPEEPIPAGSRLLTTPNVIVTPHLAGASKQTAANAARIIAEDVGRHLRGEPLLHCANPDALTVPRPA